ncbi:MAG: hypothetical protein R3C49_23545 [Planctomycetaceae bacterium]
MAKSKQQKQKDREKRVAKQKLMEAARMREIAKKTGAGADAGGARGAKVMTAGVKQQQTMNSQVQSGKPAIVSRRSGG